MLLNSLLYHTCLFHTYIFYGLPADTLYEKCFSIPMTDSFSSPTCVVRQHWNTCAPGPQKGRLVAKTQIYHCSVCSEERANYGLKNKDDTQKNELYTYKKLLFLWYLLKKRCLPLCKLRTWLCFYQLHAIWEFHWLSFYCFRSDLWFSCA